MRTTVHALYVSGFFHRVPLGYGPELKRGRVDSVGILRDDYGRRFVGGRVVERCGGAGGSSDLHAVVISEDQAGGSI